MAGEKKQYNYTSEEGVVTKLTMDEYKAQMAKDIGVNQYMAYAKNAVTSTNAPRAKLYGNFKAAVDAIEAGANNSPGRNNAPLIVTEASMNLLEDCRKILAQIENDETLYEDDKEKERIEVYKTLESIRLANDSLGDKKWREDFKAKLGEAFSKENFEKTFVDLWIAACASLIVGVIIGAVLGASGPIGWIALGAFAAYSLFKCVSWIVNAWEHASSKGLDRKMVAGKKILQAEAAMAKSGLEQPENELIKANAALASAKEELARENDAQVMFEAARTTIEDVQSSLTAEKALIESVANEPSLSVTLGETIAERADGEAAFVAQQTKFESVITLTNAALPADQKITLVKPVTAAMITELREKIAGLKDKRLPEINGKLGELNDRLAALGAQITNQGKKITEIQKKVTALTATQEQKETVHKTAVARNAKQEGIAAKQSSIKSRLREAFAPGKGAAEPAGGEKFRKGV